MDGHVKRSHAWSMFVGSRRKMHREQRFNDGLTRSSVRSCCQQFAFDFASQSGIIQATLGICTCETDRVTSWSPHVHIKSLVKHIMMHATGDATTSWRDYLS